MLFLARNQPQNKHEGLGLGPILGVDLLWSCLQKNPSNCLEDSLLSTTSIFSECIDLVQKKWMPTPTYFFQNKWSDLFFFAPQFLEVGRSQLKKKSTHTSTRDNLPQACRSSLLAGPAVWAADRTLHGWNWNSGKSPLDGANTEIRQIYNIWCHISQRHLDITNVDSIYIYMQYVYIYIYIYCAIQISHFIYIYNNYSNWFPPVVHQEKHRDKLCLRLESYPPGN